MYNSSQIQGLNSIMCGYYCCYYIQARSAGRKPIDIMLDFHMKSTLYNDPRICYKMKTYCVEEHKQTECVPGTEVLAVAKNDRSIMKCTCESCGIIKVRFISAKEKEGGNMLPLAIAAATMPLALGGLILDHETDHVLSKGIGRAIKKQAISSAKSFGASALRNLAGKIERSGVDIHKAIGKILHGKHGFILPGHHYTGPYNDLSKQLVHDDKGNILEVFDQPTGKTDAVSMQHDVDYAICKDDVPCKNKADKKMVKSLDAIPWKKDNGGMHLPEMRLQQRQN